MYRESFPPVSEPTPMSQAPEFALIFDFGNVLAFFDEEQAWNQIAAARGLIGSELRNRAYAAGLKALARQYELGEIDDAEFLRGCNACAGLNIPLPELTNAWGNIYRLNEPVATLVHQLADQGHRLVLGSNTSPIHARQFRRQFQPVLQRFHHLVLSYEIGHLKPSDRFFEFCVAHAERPAEACIFIDDIAENVAGARQVGLKAIHFQEISQLNRDLRALGVVPKQGHSPAP